MEGSVKIEIVLKNFPSGSAWRFGSNVTVITADSPVLRINLSIFAEVQAQLVGTQVILKGAFPLY